MSTHTPGPWHSFQQLPQTYDDHGYRRVAEVRKGFVIYAEADNMIQAGRGFVWGDAETDARLLAAAPDLLFCLKEMCDRMLERGVSVNDKHPDRIALQSAKISIRKATGGGV